MHTTSLPKHLGLGFALLLTLSSAWPALAAVHVDQRGVGEVLIYPYYTVSASFDNYIQVTNTRPHAKALKVRVREAMNGQAVMEANVYLSAYDHWSMLITMDEEGSGALFVSSDKSCTVPIALSQRDIVFPSTDSFTGDSINGLERTREGFIEVLEMGTFREDTPSGTAWVERLQLDASSTRECDEVAEAWETGGLWQQNPQLGLSPVSGGLKGYGVLIEVETGASAVYDAVALNKLMPGGNPLHTAPGAGSPSLANSVSGYAMLVDGEIVTGTAQTGIDAVSAVLMQSSITNEFVLEPTIGAGTEWVVTFPTKHHHVNGSGNPAPFSTRWSVETSSSCDIFSFSYWNREAEEPTPPLAVHPTWPWITIIPPEFCAQANVFSYANGNPDEGVFGASADRNRTAIYLEEGFNNGWGEISFETSEPSLITDPHRFYGLPAVGFALQRYVNGDVPYIDRTVRANYAGIVEHKGEVRYE